MPEIERPQVGEGEEASSKLNEGLKTCRAMVANYRAMLTEAPAGVQSGTSTEYLNDVANGGFEAR